MPDGVVVTAPARRDCLESVQAARGLAALMVVLFHCGRMLSLPQYVGYIPLGGIFNFGHSGVDFFFVLSGFIIMHVHRGDLGRPDRLPRYAWRRLTRILPMYWIVTGIVIAIDLFASDWAQRLPVGYVLRSILLLPQDRGPLLGVGWTLEHEMLFYGAFGLALLWRPLGPVLAALGAGLALAGPWLPQSFILNYLGAFYHLHFLLGVLVAMAVERGRVPAPRALALIGVAAFLGTGLAEDAGLLARAGTVSQACFGLASGAILTGLVGAERQGLIAVRRALVLLGAASYSTYLIHTVAIGLALHALGTLGVFRVLPGWLAMAVGVGVGLGSGLALYLLVERRITALVKRREVARRDRARTAVAA